jgi:nucleoside-diphosphate-sugar epimerase
MSHTTTAAATKPATATTTSTARILLTGSNGQIGTVLAAELRKMHGAANVVCSDIATPSEQTLAAGPFERLDVLDATALREVIARHGITVVYHLSAVLSARGEADPARTWDINTRGLLHVLDCARDGLIQQVFFPSTIAVFGPNIPQDLTGDDVVLNPTTVYGMSKAAGENWCAYYHQRWGVDVRSLRYPGVIGHQSLPGGGTTDYAVDIFHQALETGRFECFLKADQALPMIYMEDAIRATIELMNAPAEQIKRRTSYNLAGISFTPAEIAAEIAKQVPGFEISYKPDFRQAIAASWPRSLNDDNAKADWGWQLRYDLRDLVADMLINLRAKQAPQQAPQQVCAEQRPAPAKALAQAA